MNKLDFGLMRNCLGGHFLLLPTITTILNLPSILPFKNSGKYITGYYGALQVERNHPLAFYFTIRLFANFTLAVLYTQGTEPCHFAPISNPHPHGKEKNVKNYLTFRNIRDLSIVLSSILYFSLILGLKLIVQISTRMLEIMIHIIADVISICQCVNIASFTNTIIIRVSPQY